VRNSTLKKRLLKMQEQLGKDRDALRDIESDAGGLADTCERAYEALTEAIDALSELA
jgi:hypothetical protein